MDSDTDSTSKKSNIDTYTLTPLQTGLAGAAVLVVGASITGGTHYVSTAKQLAEEGIPLAARTRALPLAAQALAVSTAMCAMMGALAVTGWHLFGFESRSVAEVSTFRDAVSVAKQHRDLVRQELRTTLAFDQPPSGDPEHGPS